MNVKELEKEVLKGIEDYVARWLTELSGLIDKKVGKANGKKKGLKSRLVKKGQGQPCKPGEAAERTGCIPAKEPEARKPGQQQPQHQPRPGEPGAPTSPYSIGVGTSKETVWRRAVQKTTEMSNNFIKERGITKQLSKTELKDMVEVLEKEIRENADLYRALASACQEGTCNAQQERYTVELYSGEHATAYLLRWGEGQQAEWHDHGDGDDAAWVSVRVLEGPVENDFLTRSGKVLRQTIPEGKTVLLPPRYIHRVATGTSKPTWSVHVYSSKNGGLDKMHFYKFDEKTNMPILDEKGQPEVISDWSRKKALRGNTVTKQELNSKLEGKVPGKPADGTDDVAIFGPDEAPVVFNEETGEWEPIPSDDVTEEYGGNKPTPTEGK